MFGKFVLRILITNQKGGVGKSTISANLAHYFASTLNKRTTLVDFDTQASSSKWVRSIKPQRITVFKGTLPLSDGASRILIESRKIVQGVYGRSEIVIADLTWFDVFDSEMLLDFDIVILPTAISEVELIATMEFAARHEWVFQSYQSPSLVIVPSRVRGDQAVKFLHNTERFPFGFLLTPPIIDSVEAKKNFGVKFLLDLKNHKLSNSFRVFCESIEQVARIHFDRNKNNDMPSQPPRAKLASTLNYNIKKAHAIRTLDKQKISVTNLEEQGKQNLLPISSGNTITSRESQNTREVSEPGLGSFQESNFFDNNNFAQDENYAEGTYGKQKLVRKEPQPILSVSRKVLGRPPKFLRKENSTK